MYRIFYYSWHRVDGNIKIMPYDERAPILPPPLYLTLSTHGLWEIFERFIPFGIYDNTITFPECVLDTVRQKLIDEKIIVMVLNSVSLFSQENIFETTIADTIEKIEFNPMPMPMPTSREHDYDRGKVRLLNSSASGLFSEPIGA